MEVQLSGSGMQFTVKSIQLTILLPFAYLVFNLRL